MAWKYTVIGRILD